MTKNSNKKETNKIDHTTYGGEITSYDFYGRNTVSDITARIMRDLKFDQQCKRNIELKKVNIRRKK